MSKIVRVKEEKLSPQMSRRETSHKRSSRRGSSSSDSNISYSDHGNSRSKRVSSQIRVSSKVEVGRRRHQSTDSESKSSDSSRSISPRRTERSRPKARSRSSGTDSSSDRHCGRRSISPADRDRVRSGGNRPRDSRYSSDSDNRRLSSHRGSRSDRKVQDDKRQKRSPEVRQRNRSPADKRRLRSPENRQRKRSPEDKRRFRSPEDRQRNRSPEDRLRNRSSEDRQRNRSPDDRRRYRSPDDRHRHSRKDGSGRAQPSPSNSPASDDAHFNNQKRPTHSHGDQRRDARSRSSSESFFGSSSGQDNRQRESDSSPTSSDSDDSEATRRTKKRLPAEKSRSSSSDRKDGHKSTTKKKKSSRSDRRNSPLTDAVSKSAAEEGWIMGKLKQLQEEKVAKKSSHKKEKEILKLMETPEEKRLRRLLKKEAKERKRKERMGWDKDYMHYTNTDNPFGDANLLETFVWQKKLERDGITDVSTEILEQRSRMKQEENKYELEKVKKRRLEREQERAQRDEEMALMQSQKEAAQFMEWEKQEDTFHLQQALLRSKIRIEDGRAKPIDLLAKYISTEDEDLAVDMHEPYTYLNGLTIRDLEDLLEDIKVYMELEKGKNLDYWNDITIIVDDELYKLRKVDAANREHFGDRREGIHVSVNSEVNSVFKGKTHSQLAALHNQIIRKITGGEEGIDIGYWESLLSQLKAQMARARLRDRHQENLRRKLFQLKQEQGVESEPTFPIVEESVAATAEGPSADVFNKPLSPSRPGPSKPNADPKFIAPPEVDEANEDSDQQADFDTILTEEDLRDHSMEEYVSGGYSPKLTRLDSLEPGTLLIDPYDDAKCLDYARNQLIGTGRLHSELTPEERAFEKEARTGMNDDEAMFSVETPLDHKMYLWSDKYRPRKPRYFNRVHTGFEWNKYNQTHYDMDNPPPKIVQGYKFNIFYPDLIDKSITPEYTLTPCPDNKDFAILRFHAGPPYEDIAFKIVNREWEYSYKRGFRCQFHNNIFQLWFHFKRYRYRR